MKVKNIALLAIVAMLPSLLSAAGGAAWMRAHKAGLATAGAGRGVAEQGIQKAPNQFTIIFAGKPVNYPAMLGRKMSLPSQEENTIQDRTKEIARNPRFLTQFCFDVLYVITNGTLVDTGRGIPTINLNARAVFETKAFGTNTRDATFNFLVAADGVNPNKRHHGMIALLKACKAAALTPKGRESSDTLRELYTEYGVEAGIMWNGYSVVKVPTHLGKSLKDPKIKFASVIRDRNSKIQTEEDLGKLYDVIFLITKGTMRPEQASIDDSGYSKTSDELWTLAVKLDEMNPSSGTRGWRAIKAYFDAIYVGRDPKKTSLIGLHEMLKTNQNNSLLRMYQKYQISKLRPGMPTPIAPVKY